MLTAFPPVMLQVKYQNRQYQANTARSQTFKQMNMFGGQQNETDSTTSVILGGLNNTIKANGNSNVIGGGSLNTMLLTGVEIDESIIAGGNLNTLDGSRSSILGGCRNYLQGDKSSILGGESNSLIGTNSILFSNASTLQANCSAVIGGSNINVNTDNTVYVPQLNIGNLYLGTPIKYLGLDSNGFVVEAPTPIPTQIFNGTFKS